MDQTTNYSLSKPSYEEGADIEILNQNMDIIDEKLKSLYHPGITSAKANTGYYYVKLATITIPYINGYNAFTWDFVQNFYSNQHWSYGAIMVSLPYSASPIPIIRCTRFDARDINSGLIGLFGDYDAATHRLVLYARTAGGNGGGTITLHEASMQLNDPCTITYDGVTWSDQKPSISGTEITGNIINAAPLNSPVFTGVPTAPTPDSMTNTTQIATTAYVRHTAVPAWPTDIKYVTTATPGYDDANGWVVYGQVVDVLTNVTAASIEHLPFAEAGTMYVMKHNEINIPGTRQIYITITGKIATRRFDNVNGWYNWYYNGMSDLTWLWSGNLQSNATDITLSASILKYRLIQVIANDNQYENYMQSLILPPGSSLGYYIGNSNTASKIMLPSGTLTFYFKSETVLSSISGFTSTMRIRAVIGLQ